MLWPEQEGLLAYCWMISSGSLSKAASQGSSSAPRSSPSDLVYTDGLEERSPASLWSSPICDRAGLEAAIRSVRNFQKQDVCLGRVNYRIVGGGGPIAIERRECRAQDVIVRGAAGPREGKWPELAETVGDGGR